MTGASGAGALNSQTPAVFTFGGWQLRNAVLDGPYRLTNVYVTKTTDQVFTEYFDDLHTTAAYQASQFGSLPLLLANVQHQLVDRNSNGLADRLVMSATLSAMVLDGAYDWSGRRTTLSYEAATPADQAVINAYGDLYATPPNLIYLKPVLRINGVAVAQGGRIRAGLAHSTKRYYLKPAGDLLGNSSTTHPIFAGEYQGIAFDTFRARLGAVIDTTNPITPDPDGVLGAELYRTAMAYQDRLGQSWELAADTMQVVYATSVAQAVVTNRLQVFNNLSGVPVVWEPQGPTVDAQNKTVGGAYSVSSGASELNQFLILVGADGSILENRVFEELYEQEAISTIKVLALANDADIPICVLTASNLGDCSIMYQSQSLINLINLALTLGYEVVAPKNSLTYHDWHGGGFIARHPVTKVGVWYIIENGLNGGATVDNLLNWVDFWRDIFIYYFRPPCSDEPALITEVLFPDEDSYWPAQKGWLDLIPFNPWNIRNLKPVITYKTTYCFISGATKTHMELTRSHVFSRLDLAGDHTFSREGMAQPFHYTVFDVQIATPDGLYVPAEGDGLRLNANVIPRMPPASTVTWSTTGAGTFSAFNEQLTQFEGQNVGGTEVAVSVANANGPVTDEQELSVFKVAILPDSIQYVNKGYDAPLAAPPITATIHYQIEPAPGFFGLGGFTPQAVTLTITSGDSTVLTAILPASAGLHSWGWDGKDNAGQYVAAGAYVVRIDVAAASGVKATSTHTVHVVEVQAVQLLDSSGHELDFNPHPTHPGGRRIFPDRPLPGEPRNNVVKVRATLSTDVPANALPIYFESYDVNDPTGLLNDNHEDPTQGIAPTGKITDTVSDGDNTGEVDFIVTMQPGDNFKVFASTNRALLDNLDDVTVEASTNLTGTTTDPLLQPLASERLTVWRRLHIEVDSMGNVTGNQITGTITSVINHGITSTVTTNQNFFEPDSLITQTHRFQDGQLLSGGERYAVITNTYGNNLAVIVNNIGATAPITGPFTLVDDDDFNSDDGVTLDGDIGEGIGTPDTSLIQDSDVITDNIFAAAYVRPIYDIGGNSDVTYTINVYPGDTSHYDFAGQATEANSDYWTVYLIGAYQGWTREDGDGEDRVILGQVNKINGVGASIFSETIDHESTPTAYIFNAATTAHEIGHLFKGSHDGTYGMDGGIMDQSATRGSLSFTDATLKKIRDIDHP